MKVKINTIQVIVAMILLPGCGLLNPFSEEGAEIPIEDRLYSWEYLGDKIYTIDMNNLEVVKVNQIKAPNGFILNKITLSSDGKYFVFDMQRTYGEYVNGFVTYDLDNEFKRDYFFIDVLQLGATRISPAYNLENNGLIYWTNYESGLYIIDIIKKEIVETIIPPERAGFLEQTYRRFSHSSQGRWSIVNLTHNPGGWEELEFYEAKSGLKDLEFVLNEGNEDNISIFTFMASEEVGRVFLIYSTAFGRGENAKLFGTYDLVTRELMSNPLTLPDGMGSGFMEYSHRRNEIYFTGYWRELYILDASTYTIKEVVVFNEPTYRLLIRPDEEVLFISSPHKDNIVALDLNTRKVISRMKVDHPTEMFIRN